MFRFVKSVAEESGTGANFHDGRTFCF